MTSEPKFIPEEAALIAPDGAAPFRIRMIDTVGYMVDGATGATEDGVPRMVATPWYDYEIPMTQAAELGTKKVMEEHCSIGLVVTTDGTVTDIPREDYLIAEERAIRDMQATGKPFLVVVNSKESKGKAAEKVQAHIKQRFGIDAQIADCQALDVTEICTILRSLLYAFPLQEVRIFMPRWVNALEPNHPIKTSLQESLLHQAQQTSTLQQTDSCLNAAELGPNVKDLMINHIDLATGTVFCTLIFPEALFYQIISEKTNIPISDDAALLSLLTELSEIKKEYALVADALASVRATGYGIVMPNANQMRLETPEILKKNGAYGVKLKAGAPSIHMIRVDVDTQISPMVGDEQQSRELISYLCSEDPEKLWQSNIFGKSVYTLIQDGLNTKLIGISDDLKVKFRDTLARIVNEGASGLICLIL